MRNNLLEQRHENAHLLRLRAITRTLLERVCAWAYAHPIAQSTKEIIRVSFADFALPCAEKTMSS
eukprot:6177658-Pleurochrysis_carterae.AAC.1